MSPVQSCLALAEKCLKAKTSVAVWIALAMGLAAQLPSASVRADNPPTLEWIRQFGRDTDDSLTGLEVNGSQSVLVSGFQRLDKFDASGDLRWTIELSGSLRGLSVDALGEIFVTGNFGNGERAEVRKYDSLGSSLWTRELQLPYAIIAPNAVAVDGQGNAYVTGTCSNNADVFIVKYDSAGDLLWSRQFPETSTQDIGRDIAVDNLGNAYITGIIDGAFGGRNHDAFVAKYDSVGNELWIQQLESNNYDEGAAIAVDTLGNIFVGGFTGGNLGGLFQGELDAFLARYNDVGELLWTKQLATPGTETISDIGIDNLGNAYLAGWTSGDLAGPNLGGFDAFLAKYGAAGELVWSHQFGTEQSDQAYAVANDQFGRIYLAGVTRGNLVQAPVGPSDAFLARFDQRTFPEPPTGILIGFAGIYMRLRLGRKTQAFNRGLHS